MPGSGLAIGLALADALAVPVIEASPPQAAGTVASNGSEGSSELLPAPKSYLPL